MNGGIHLRTADARRLSASGARPERFSRGTILRQRRIYGTHGLRNDRILRAAAVNVERFGESTEEGQRSALKRCCTPGLNVTSSSRFQPGNLLLHDPRYFADPGGEVVDFLDL